MEILLHGHHNHLLSIVSSKKDRVAYVKRTKPRSQHKLRLRLLQSIPPKLLPVEVVWAAKTWYKTARAWDKAVKRPDETRIEAWRKAVKDWNNFLAVCDKRKNELETLHQKLCVSGCPWNGNSILSY